MLLERGELGCICDGPVLLMGAAAGVCDASVMMATKNNLPGPLLSLELFKPPAAHLKSWYPPSSALLHRYFPVASGHYSKQLAIFVLKSFDHALSSAVVSGLP